MALTILEVRHFLKRDKNFMLFCNLFNRTVRKKILCTVKLRKMKNLSTSAFFAKQKKSFNFSYHHHIKFPKMISGVSSFFVYYTVLIACSTILSVHSSKVSFHLMLIIFTTFLFCFLIITGIIIIIIIIISENIYHHYYYLHHHHRMGLKLLLDY